MGERASPGFRFASMRPGRGPPAAGLWMAPLPGARGSLSLPLATSIACPPHRRPRGAGGQRRRSRLIVVNLFLGECSLFIKKICVCLNTLMVFYFDSVTTTPNCGRGHVHI